MQDNDDDENLSFYLGPFIPGLTDEIVLSDGTTLPVECDDTSVIFLPKPFLMIVLTLPLDRLISLKQNAYVPSPGPFYQLNLGRFPS